jgi:YidC/Oxa1 family membrane protein insertase
MDRNTIIGLVLIGVIMIVFSIYNTPSKEELAKQKHTLDSLSLAQIKEKQDSVVKTAQFKAARHPDSSQVTKSAIKDTSIFSNDSTGTNEKFTTVDLDKMKVTFTNKGGEIYSVEIKNYKTWDKKPLILFSNNEDSFSYEFFVHGKKINTGNLYFTCDKGNLQLKGQEKETISFRSYAGSSGKYIEEQYQFTGNSYEINYSFNLVNMDSLIPANRDITLDWNESLNKLEENPDDERRYTAIYYKFLGEDVDNLSPRSNDSKTSLPKLEWISFKQHFFNSTLIYSQGFEDGNLSVANAGTGKELKLMHADANLSYSPQPKLSYNMQWYFGPNSFYGLKKLGIGLEQIIPLGYTPFQWISTPVNKWIIIPIFYFLSKYISNYGIIILLLTIFLRIVLLPFTYKSFLSGAKMKVLKPEIDELKDKYKGDQTKFGQEQMKLFQKAGVSPLGGCLPLLFQMPILVAMYSFFPSSIELRQQHFLWVKDLSSYDSIYNFSTNIPLIHQFYGNHVSLFTLLMLVSQILMSWYNSQYAVGMNNQMKWMQYIFPIFLVGIFNSLPAALTYYYFLSNILSLIIMVIIREFFIDEKAIHAQIQENKKKTPKRGGWMERLEKMQREQQKKNKR